MSMLYFFRSTLVFSFIFLISFSLAAQRVIERTSPTVKTMTEANAVLSSVEFYQINMLEVSKLLNTTEKIELEIPVGNRFKTILLEKTNILSPNYRLYSSSGKTLNTANKYSFYFGKVQGKSSSKVSMIYYDDQLSMSIFDDDGNFEINKEGELYAGYFNHDRKEPLDLDWQCKVIDESNSNSDRNQPDLRSNSTPECVTVFLELDNNIYVEKGSNIANAEAWAMTLFSQVAILYMEHNVPLNISGIQVWDTTDPYVSATNTSQALALFKTAVHSNPNFNGRLAHLLSGRGLGGGIAYLNVLCHNYSNIAVSANLNGGNVPYPTYSWNVTVVAHEIGHNMGSNHTQACVWNGNNTAIDGCGNIEGSCPDPGNPPNSVGGTIMSYCHLTTGINFNNGFGPQPGKLIEEKYLNATCMVGENCAAVSPFNDVCRRSKTLPVLNYCVKGYFENYATTPSGDGGSMTCGDSGVENDIWYQFDYLDVDTIHLEIQATDIITDLVVEIYSGDCNSLVSIDCGYSISGSPISFVLADPSLINNDVFIRIVEKGSDEEGEFSICIYSEELPCQNQLDTLLNIYQDLNGPNWTTNTGWLSGDQSGTCDYCNWHGITCNYLGQIIAMDLSANNLQGMMPQDLVALINLKTLRLNNNLLFDTLPNYWDSLDLLSLLDLRFNAFTGSIPFSFTTMTKINTIHLDNNSFGNVLPLGLGYNTTLQTFTASNNLLQGCFSNGISNFCYRDSINLSNNPDLPYAGDVTLLCAEGWGSDLDLDGYCNEVEDCNDYDAEIHPGADEILCDAKDNNCNGVIDEGSNFGPNIWIGPDTLGVFDDTLNWSLNHIPSICENVEIGMQGDTIDLILSGNGTGEGSQGGLSNNLQIRNLSIGTHATVHLPESKSMNIIGSGVIVNDGTFNITGYVSIRDQKNTTNTAFLNNGTVNVIARGGLNINNIGHFGIHNSSTGMIVLFGSSYIDSYRSDGAKSAIINEGTITIYGNMGIYGTYLEDKIKNTVGGAFEVKTGGSCFVDL